MNLLRKTYGLVFIFISFVTYSVYSQETNHKSFTKFELLHAARDIIGGVSTCALITLDLNGLPRVRVMDPFPPEKDFTIWLATNPNSGKVNQIKNNPNVTLYYLENNASGYVVIHGIAQLVNDQKEKDLHWKTEWEAFYPNNTDAYLLIRISPQWMEIVSYEHGIIGDPSTWEAPKVLFDDPKVTPP